MPVIATRTTCLSIFALLVSALASISCTSRVVPQRTILEQTGEIRGLTEKSYVVDADAGEVILVVLKQSGLDLNLQLSSGDHEVLGKFESMTGRYGEEIAQIEIERAGPLTVTIGAPRFPRMTGKFALLVKQVGSATAADRSFSRASRVGSSISTKDRIAALENAIAGYKKEGRLHEYAIAALSLLNVLNEFASDSATAVKYGNEAVGILRREQSPLLRATALNSLAVALGEAAQAELRARSFAEALTLFNANEAPVGAAEVRLYDAALAYYDRGPDAVLPIFSSVADECETLNETVCESSALISKGVALRDLGDYDAASRSIEKAMAIIDVGLDGMIYAQARDNMAFLLRMLGDFDAAIQLHQIAMSEYAGSGECTGVSRMLYGIGYALLGMGDREQAVRFYRLALDRSCEAKSLGDVSLASPRQANSSKDLCELARQAGSRDPDDRSVASWVARDMGNMARSEQDLETASLCHDLSIELATGDYALSAKLDKVRDLITLGRGVEAENLLSEVRAKVRTTDSWLTAQVTHVDGLLLALSKDKRDAIARLRMAADAFVKVRNHAGEYTALSQRASLAKSTRDPKTNEYFEEADAALENVRLLSLDPSFSASLFASGRRVYEEWIESRLAPESKSRPSDPILESLLISERSRSRLLSQVAKVSHVGKAARAAQIRSLSLGTAAFLQQASTGNFMPVRVQPPADYLLGINRNLGIESERFDSKSRRDSIDRIRQFQRTLSDDESAVEFLLGQRSSHAWVVRRESIARFDLADAATIREAVNSARLAITSNASADRVKTELGRVYEMVVLPIESAVAGSHLAIVADDVLHDVPFAALWDRSREQFFIERMSISYLPSLQFAVSRGPSESSGSHRSPTALLVGDPVYEFDDAQLRCATASGQTRPVEPSRHRRLPASGREVQAIHAMFAAHSANVTTLTGCAANRDAILEKRLDSFTYIHFATHATADAAVPQRSAIHLSAFDQNGKPSVSDFSADDLLDHRLKAELVVLSGCSTAGGKQFGGEGSLGLTFSLIAGGSRQVLSTLWPVSDAASVNAMSLFYRGLVDRGSNATDSLRSMQLEMLSDKRWSHPRNWAAYSLLGT